MPGLLLAAAIGSLLATGAHSLDVDWNIPSGQPYEPVVGTVGDTIRFEYTPGWHNVVIHPTGTCDDEGAIYVGSTSPTEYTFEKAGLYTFACDVAMGAHCSLGQIINVTITGSASSSDENADGGEDPEDETGGEVPSEEDDPSVPEGGDLPLDEEDPDEVLERYSKFFNPGEQMGMLEFRIKPYKIPHTITTYVDFLFNIPEDMAGEIVHVVTGDVIISQPKHLHHFVMTGCTERFDPSEEGLPLIYPPDSCVIPLGGAWAVGGDFFGGIPSDSGQIFGIGLGIKAVSLNLHYTDGLDINPTHPNDGTHAIATDGIRIFYTPNLRPKTVLFKPLINIGSGPRAMNLPPNVPRYFYTKTCTVEPSCQDTSDEHTKLSYQYTCKSAKSFCSSVDIDEFTRMRMHLLCPATCGLCDDGNDGDVAAGVRKNGDDFNPVGYQVSSVNYHAHLLGREMYTTLLPNKSSDVLIDLESKDSWLFDYQVTYPLHDDQQGEPHFKVLPGDKIQVTCVYDSTPREDTTYFDLSTYDEMCITQVGVIVDTPDIATASSASLITMLNLKSFKCALDDDSHIWGGSLDAGEDARDIWKDHPMLEADCTFPVGTVDGDGLALLGDTTPTYEYRCASDKDGYVGDNNAICDGSDINEATIVGESCEGGSMDGVDSSDASSYEAGGDASFAELCTTKGGISQPYNCKQLADYISMFKLEEIEDLKVTLWPPKCCQDYITMCDGNEKGTILDEAAIAGEKCQGGLMDGANSNDPSNYEAEGSASFKEQCITKGGNSEPYTCMQVEHFLNGQPEELDDIIVFYQPKCCTARGQDDDTSSSTSRDDLLNLAGDGSGDEPGEEATDGSSQEQDGAALGNAPSAGPNDGPGEEATSGSFAADGSSQEQDGAALGDAPSAGPNDGPGEEVTSGSFAESPSLLFLLSAVPCFLANF